MRKVIDLILLVAVLCVAAWYWHTHGERLRATARIIKARAFPCSGPITYSIGAVDPRYDLTAAEFSAYIREAEAVWENAYKRNLFEAVSSSGDIVMSMVYDQRQAAVDKLKGMGLETERSMASYEALKARYEEVSAWLSPRQADLTARLDAYKRNEAEYNAVVAAYNSRGSATPRQKRRLDSARAALSREYTGMKQLERNVNGDIDLLNALATTINQLIVEFNINVEQYNREGSALGVYEEGVYILNGTERAIEIYKFHDRPQLVRLLAHEMGHALGLEHIPDPAALMSPINRGSSLELLPSDLGELGRACTSPLRRGKGR